MAKRTSCNGCNTIIGENGQRKRDYSQTPNVTYGIFNVTETDKAPVRLDRGFIKAHVTNLRKMRLSEEQVVDTMKCTVEGKVDWTSEKLHQQFFEDVLREFYRK